MRVGETVLVHSIGPGGVLAKILEISGDSFKITWYDARDGGSITRWVDRKEIA
tara:strand:- start:51207 stop:51365 length:159 start_codon:yes stop_codon:yes gene_type:complete